MARAPATPADPLRHLAGAGDPLRLLEAALETVPVGVVLADATGRIVYGNRLVETMMRHPVRHSADADSYGEWIAFHEDGRRVASHEYPLARVVREGAELAEIEVQYQRGDGTRFWLRIIGRPVIDAAGRRIGAAVALIDIDQERQMRATQALLIGELDHRVKNAFAVVRAIVSQSLRHAAVAEPVRAALEARLDNYAAAHARLVSAGWDESDLAAVLRGILEGIAPAGIAITGPAVRVPTRQALTFSMVAYELATNAVKYGALSVPAGRVALGWAIGGTPDAPTLTVDWRERGGPAVTAPRQRGFGTLIVDRAIALETGGTVTIDFAPAGLHWRLVMPLPEQGAATPGG